MATHANVPVYHPDLYSAAAVRDPYPHYARLRELGPVVWLRKQKVYALPRYAECKAVLRDAETFISGQGVGLNKLVNRLGRGTTLYSDGDDHARRRAQVAHRLTPRALRMMAETVERQAIEVVEAAVARRRIDGVEFATALPMAVVPDFVGWPRDVREHLLHWGGASFDIQGPFNRQAVRSIPATLRTLRFAHQVVRDRSVLAGSMGDDLLRAADEGKVPRAECPMLMIDYLVPSLDTTISAISSALHLFATHPEQWCVLKSDPSLIPNAVNEVVRYASPLRAFSRKVTRAAEVAGTTIPRDARLLVIYASANRDAQEWDDPDTFDIRRDAARQLGFGHGKHGCAGQGLARLETAAMGMDEAAVLPRFRGVAVHDAWAPYDTYVNADHQLCCAHALRELQAVADTAAQADPDARW